MEMDIQSTMRTCLKERLVSFSDVEKIKGVFHTYSDLLTVI